MKRVILLISALYFLPIGTLAQSDEKTTQPRIYTHAINTYPYGPLLGLFVLNYEILIRQRHGFFLEAAYIDYRGAILKAFQQGIGGRVNIQYRWHLSGAMESFFVGTYVRYYNFTHFSTENIATDGKYNFVGFDMNIMSYGAGLNIGWRWVGSKGENFAIRIGYGPSTVSASATRSDPSILQRVADLKNSEVLYGGIDGEISVGYAF